MALLCPRKHEQLITKSNLLGPVSYFGLIKNETMGQHNPELVKALLDSYGAQHPEDSQRQANGGQDFMS